MLTVTQLASSCGLSRSTLLYYESIGLVKPAARTEGNYRNYSAADLERLRRICVYREAGLKLADIRTILARPDNDASAVLQNRLVELSAEIAKLRGHQLAILRLLKHKNSMKGTKMITKQKWVAIMKGAGFSEADMHRWHAEFEKSAPQEHQEFLEFLHIPKTEIQSIREASRKRQAQ